MNSCRQFQQRKFVPAFLSRLDAKSGLWMLERSLLPLTLFNDMGKGMVERERERKKKRDRQTEPEER